MADGTESRAAFDELLATLTEAADRYAGAEWGLAAPTTSPAAARAREPARGRVRRPLRGRPAPAGVPADRDVDAQELGDNADAIYFDTAVSADVLVPRARPNRAARSTCRSRSRRARPTAASPTAPAACSTTRSSTSTPTATSRSSSAGAARPQLDRARPRRVDASRRATTGSRSARPRSRRSPTSRSTIEVLDDHAPAARRRPTRRSPPASAGSSTTCARARSSRPRPVRATSPRSCHASRTRSRRRSPPGDHALAAFDASYTMAPYVLGPDEALVMTGALARVPVRERVALEPSPADVRLRAPAACR